jgi:electron transport complex protein RnfC
LHQVFKEALNLLLKTFKGGVHPNDCKRFTKDFAIEEMPAPPTMIFPIIQHIGAPSEIVVKKGDYVKVGQLIAKQTGFVSANHHSSVSGTVKSIEAHFHPNGSMVDSIIIENDGKYDVFEDVKPAKPLEQLTDKEIVQIVSDAGIVGMGGASFPTHVKLVPPEGTRIDYVIINCAECEPYLTSDYRAMLEDGDDIIFGCKAIMKTLSAPKCLIVVEDNKKDAARHLENLLKDEENISVVVVKTKYPQGSEKHIIFSATGRKVPSGKLPADVGVFVANTDTAASIARAVKTGMPLISRIVTVTGGAIKNKKNLRVRIGTPIRNVIEAAGGFVAEPERIILGGPMMGKGVFSIDLPVIKGTSAILAMTKEDLGINVVTNCTRCGKCVQACPMRLVPVTLAMHSKNENEEMLKKYHVTDCIECGACSYICPARKDPLQMIRVGKRYVIDRARMKKAQ